MPPIDPIIRIGWQPAIVRSRVIEFQPDMRERVLQWEFTDKSAGADKGKLVLDNTGYVLSDHEAFAPGVRFHVQWGYAHDIYPTRTITIEKVKLSKTIELEGSATAARGLIGQQRTRTFEDATEFEVAEEVARGLGFVSVRSREIDPGDIVVERRGITQAGETDMAFLQRLARRVGATMYIAGNVFHFHERRLGRRPALTFTYFNDQVGHIIGDPSIEHTIQGRPGRVSRRGRSPRQRRDVTGDASNREDRRRPTLGEELCVSDPQGLDWNSIARDLGIEEDEIEQFSLPPQEEAQSDVSASAAETDEEATSQARQRFRGAERSSIKMSLALVGNPQVRADGNIRVEGLGEKYSGNWYVAEAVHTVNGSGYRTKVKLQRNATSRSRGTGRSRRRVVDQASASMPSGTELPFTSEFNTWDCWGDVNNEETPNTDVEQVDELDNDGQTRARFHPTTGQPESRPADPWEEDW